MTTVSSTTPTPPTVSIGKAQDVSQLNPGSIGLSLTEAVTAKVQPYLDQATAVQTQLTANQADIAAYQSMQSLLQALQSAAANLSSQALQGSNVFNSRVANLEATSVVQGMMPSSPTALLSASVATGTATGSHTVIVNQVASAEADVSDTLAVGSTAPLSALAGFPASGSFTINEAGKTPVSINVTSSMTLAGVASAINAATSQTGVTASVVSVDAGHSVLVITGTDTDTALQFSDGSGILANLGVVSAATSLTGTTQEADSSAALGLSGSFTINGGGTVTVAAGDSLTAIQNKINAAAGATGISATIIGAGPYQLQINSGGAPIAFSGVTGNVLSGLGISQVAANGAAHQATAPQAANLTVDGVSGITRTTNTISDVLSGVTMNLVGADPNTVVTLNVAPDNTAAASAIQAFATAYNNWETFVTQNQATNGDGSKASSAVLFGDSTLRQASLAVDSMITSKVNDMTLGAIGVTLDANNNLQIDSTKLSQALTSNFQGVFGLFQSQLTTDQPYLQPLGTDYSTYSGPSFSLGIDGSGQPTVNGVVSTDFTVNGSVITGNLGGPYGGMSFTFTGAPGQSANVTATQGIANGLFSATNLYANPFSGTIQTMIGSLQTEDTGLSQQYTTLTSEAQSYTNFLLQQYSTLTSQIASANQTYLTLQTIIATQTARQ